MGLSCVNLHFRTIDDKAVSASLIRRGISQYRVVPAKSGWTSLYEEQASHQDDERIRDLASGLSEDLHAAAVAFLVHDSDIACFWLFDNGLLLDEYNSCPDYFDAEATDDESPRPSGGQPNVLLRYCRPGIQEHDLAAALAEESDFAESVIERLAQALGIDRDRVLSDYRDFARGEGLDGSDGPDDSHGDDHGGGGNVKALRTGMANRLAAMFGSDPRSAAANPQALALVQASADGNTDEIGRLLAEGVDVDLEAPAPLPGGQPMAGLGQILADPAMKIAMTPLLAAIVNKRRRAAEQLLNAGAAPNRIHPLFGPPVHAATGAGEVELLQLLIDHGGDVNARNAQGQSPLQVLAAGRATRDRLAQAQAMMKSMGVKIPGLVDQLSNLALPTEGWDACERLLKSHGAR